MIHLTKKPFQALLLVCIAAAPGFAGTLFQGTFSEDNQVQLFSFTAASPELITIQTSSYGGDGGAIPAGGFEPTAFIFDSLGDGPLVVSNGTCSQVMEDPSTGACNDLFFQDTLGPGTFTLALAVYDNPPNGNFPRDGFTQDSNPGFTCQETFTTGNFCDVSDLGVTRTGDFAITFTGADSVIEVGAGAAPEPTTIALFSAAGALLFLVRRRIPVTVTSSSRAQ